MSLQKIKQEALVLFATKGYEGTSLNDIAVQVGIRKPSLYAHMESKEQLFMLIVADLYQEYTEEFTKAYQESKNFSVEQKLFHIFKVLFQYLAEQKEKAMLWNRIFFFPPETLKEPLAEKMHDLDQHFAGKLAEIIDQGVEEGIFRAEQTETVIRAYYCMTDGYIMHRMYYGFQDKDYELEKIWNFFWNGLKAK